MYFTQKEKPELLHLIYINWSEHGSTTIGSLIDLDNADEKVTPYKAINITTSNDRTQLVHAGNYVEYVHENVC